MPPSVVEDTTKEEEPRVTPPIEESVAVAGDNWGWEEEAEPKSEPHEQKRESAASEDDDPEALILSEYCTSGDVLRFRNHQGYRLDIIRSMLESTEQGSLDAAMELSEMHWSQSDAAAYHISWLLLEDSLEMEWVQAQIEAWRELAVGEELEGRIRKEVMPSIRGNDHARLGLCYSLLAACKERVAGPGSGKSMAGHAGVLSKCAKVAPSLDYKLLLRANSPKASDEEVVLAMQHLEAIVDKSSVSYLSKLLSKIKRLKDVGLEGTPAGHLPAVLLLREVGDALQAGTAGELYQGGGPGPMDGLAVPDTLFVVRRLVCNPEQGARLPAMLRLLLVDGAMMAEEIEGLESRSEALPTWKAHLSTVIKLEAASEELQGVDVSYLDAAGPDPSRRVHALMHLIGKGASVSLISTIVKRGYALSTTGAAWDAALCDVYKMAVQLMIEHAMQGRAIEDLRQCLKSIQAAEANIAQVLAFTLGPSLELCKEHSATPWKVEAMADDFLSGKAVQ